MNTIQEQWDTFRKLVIPKNAPPIQVIEMKLAFYGGVEAMMRIQFNITDLSEDAGVAILEETRKELDQFANDVRTGNREDD